MTIALRSSLLEGAGIAHGFSLRTGGVSEAPWDTLNLARNVEDDPSAVDENRARFASAVGYRNERLFETSQVHARNVRWVEAGDDPVDVRITEADALVTGAPGAAVAVRVADCGPVLMADPARGLVAAVHAGWRGVAARVADAAIDVLLAHGAGAPGELIVAIGPHIRVCCFEVGDDVAAELAAQANGANVLQSVDGKPHVDIAGILRAQLVARGVRADSIDDIGGCTRCEPDRFFSYRRDGKRAGRHLATIVAPGA